MFVSMGNTKTMPAKAARRSREEWVAEVTRWRKSGLGSAEYAQQHGLNRSTLLGWSFKVGALEEPVKTQGTTHAPVGFLPVRVRERQTDKDTLSDESRIEIVLANGRAVRVAGYPFSPPRFSAPRRMDRRIRS